MAGAALNFRDVRGWLPAILCQHLVRVHRHLHHDASGLFRLLLVRRHVVPATPTFHHVAVVALDAQSTREPAHDLEKLWAGDVLWQYLQIGRCGCLAPASRLLPRRSLGEHAGGYGCDGSEGQGLKPVHAVTSLVEANALGGPSNRPFGPTSYI